MTCTLVGTETHKSRWVNFVIEQSIENSMGFVGVYVHRLRNQSERISGLFAEPRNPLEDHNMTGYFRFGKIASDQFETRTW